MAKKGKMKISKTKRNNQTTNKMKKQGKLKLQRHKKKIQKQKVPVQTQPEYSSESESSSNEWADMLDEEEQQYITNRLAKQPQLLSNIPQKEQEQGRGSKRKHKKEKTPKPIRTSDTNISDSDSGAESDADNSDVEGKYEKDMSERPAKKMRPLLPIKTKDGVMERAEECEDSESEQDEDSHLQRQQKDKEEKQSDSETDSGMEVTEDVSFAQPDVDSDEVTTVELLAARRDKLRHDKLRIGALCSSLLENPEKKLKNLFPILYLMEERLKDGALNLMSVRKLATLSAAEVFKDILPDYMIRHQDYSDIKLKKDTLAMYKYEKELLEFYKRYLQRLEKAANILRQKKGDNRKVEESAASLALLSLRCMCALLTARPQANYAANIAQSVVPFLDSAHHAARQAVTDCCVAVFADDQKGEITLTVVRLVNQLVKRRGERLRPAALDCLLALRIRDVDLDELADAQRKKRHGEQHKKRILNLSKREKKRAKKLKEVERELLETEAQESAAARRKQLTEVTKTVFHIYFRLLKSAPRAGLLAAALEGVAKFTHVINLEYYSDLVAILARLAAGAARRTRLLCARAALRVLAGAGDALSVDPARFHAHLYDALLHVHAGESHDDAPLALEAVSALCARARRVSAAVLRAFAKRLCTAAAQLPPHAALAALALLHQLAQQSKSVSSLFEADEAAGSGRFDPESPSPEHCSAHAAAAHEACALRRHHHPAVAAAAAALLAAAAWPADLHKLSPMQIMSQYDGSQMAFKPPVPPPKPKAASTKIKPTHAWAYPDLKTLCHDIEENVAMTFSESICK